MQKHITINNMFPPTTHLTLPPYKHTPTISTISTISTTTTNAYSSLKTNPKQTPLLTFYDNTLKTLYLTFDKQQQQQQQQRLHNVTLSPQQSSCYLKDKATLYKQSNSPYIINSKCNLTLFKEHIQHKAEQQQSEMNMNVKDVSDSNSNNNNTQQSTHLMKLKHKFDSFYNEVTNNDNHLLNNNDKEDQSEQNKRDSMTVYLELLAKYSKFKQALNTRTSNILYDKRSNSSNKCVVNTNTTTNKESNYVYDRNKRRKKSNLILKQCRLNIEHIKSYK